MRKKYKLFFMSSVLINVIGVLMAVFLFIKLDGIEFIQNKINPNERSYENNPYYIERTALFEGVEIKENSIVFLGDSLIQRGMWSELFPDTNVVNRGINSDTTEGVENRLTDIINSKPDKLFIMIGVNDLRYGTSKEIVIYHYEGILKQIKNGTAETEVFIQSILPVNHSMEMNVDVVRNEEIKAINVELEKIASKFNYEYVDLYLLFEKNGELNNEISYDGVHLNGQGYNTWKTEIERYIN